MIIRARDELTETKRIHEFGLIAVEIPSLKIRSGSLVDDIKSRNRAYKPLIICCYGDEGFRSRI